MQPTKINTRYKIEFIIFNHFNWYFGIKLYIYLIICTYWMYPLKAKITKADLHVLDAEPPNASKRSTYNIPKLFIVPRTMNWVTNAAPQTTHPHPPSGGLTISRSLFAVILLFNRSKIDILFTARILLNQGNESEKGWPAGQSRPWPSVKYDEMTTRICPFSFFSDKIWSNQIERTSLRGYDVINEFRHKYAIGNWKWTIILSKRSREIIT